MDIRYLIKNIIIYISQDRVICTYYLCRWSPDDRQSNVFSIVGYHR